MTPPSLYEQIEAYFDGGMSPDQTLQLERRLHGDPEAIRVYLGVMGLHAELAFGSRAVRESVSALLTPVAGADRVGSRSKALRWAARLAAAAVIVVGFTLLIAVMVRLSSHTASTARAPIATLMESQGVVWGDSDVSTSPGSPLTEGILRLKSGEAVVEFYSGARVTLTGPCEFGLNGPLRGMLRRGSLRAYCPPSAHGFTVAAPGFAVVDLGTRFRLTVDATKQARVDVEEGRVELRSPRGTLRLATHQAAHIDAAGQVAAATYYDNTGEPAAATAGFTGDVPLGALFDNLPYISLSRAIENNVPGAVVQTGNLGIDRVVQGGHGAQVVEIAPGIRLDFTPLNWAGPNGRRWPVNRGPSGGAGAVAGIEMHANLLITLDLAKIRQAGPIDPTMPMRFISDHAGIDDAGRGGAPVELLAVVSDAQKVLAVVANGQPIDAIQSGGIWRLRAPLPEPLNNGKRTVNFNVPLPPGARYLTLISAATTDTVWNDHVVFRNARLVIGNLLPIEQGENNEHP